MGFIRNAIYLGGAALVFAAGMFGSYKIVENTIDKVNDTQESIVLHNVGKDFTDEYTKTRLAYMVADHYLYNSKNIRISTLNDGSDLETAGGIVPNSISSYNSMIKEISKFENGAFVPVQPSSQEYKDILNQRNELATSLVNKTVFSQTENQEMVDFANFIVNNLDTTPKGWGIENTLGMVLGGAVSALLAIGYIALVDKIEYEYFY